jgi:hypothetical protein
MRAQRLRNTSKQAQIVCPAPILTVLLVRDDQRFMAKCPELDLVTEMDTTAAALHAMVETILKAYPYLEPEDIDEALRYAAALAEDEIVEFAT